MAGAELVEPEDDEDDPAEPEEEADDESPPDAGVDDFSDDFSALAEPLLADLPVDSRLSLR